MKLFVIHRFKDKKITKNRLKKIQQKIPFKLKPQFLNSYRHDKWKEEALNKIDQSEAVIVFNKIDCYKSENAKWEIETAKNLNKEVLYTDQTDQYEELIKRLTSLYNFEGEFNRCFSSNSNYFFKLYEIMIESSENLIQRRHRTNSFFITAIASLLTIPIILIKVDLDITPLEASPFLAFIVLLCISWFNLIGNYGKLNKAKFDVILRLEKEFEARIYYAEWISLGKGIRPNKYKPFTTTEKNIPIYFGLTVAIAWTVWFIKHYCTSF